jgi:MFS transporter, UMF1 family
MAQLASSPADAKNQRGEIIAWCMYDWANSAYSTIYITVLVGYLQRAVLPGDAGVRAYGWGIGITMLVAAFLSPVLGAIADARASKRTWLLVTTLLGSGSSALMFFATPDRPWLFVTLFVIANLNYELVQGFYNAFLPEIADDEHMGRVSAWGYGTGYVGGGLLLLIAMILLSQGEAWGLPTADGFIPRLCLLLMGLWWAVFSLPILIVVRDKSPPAKHVRSLWAAARHGLQEVGTTIRHIRSYRMLTIFLLGFLIFNDGVQTLISQASVFAEKVLDMQIAELAQVILMIQFVALPGALFVGWIADRIGQKTTLNLCLAVWVSVVVSGFLITEKWQFWIMAAATALVLGGTQSVSRTIMGLMTPEARTGEFFGFFNLSGKAVSVFGPIFFSEILARTGSAHLAIVSLLVFFVVGWVIIIPLDIIRGQHEAREGLDSAG